MSWSWQSELEKKEYEMTGQVTISTEEYKDLISKVFELHAKGQKEHDDWYEQYKKCEELEKKVEAQEKAIAHYRNYVDSSELRTADYKQYLIQKKAEEMENEIEAD